jgi:hypothetical protein
VEAAVENVNVYVIKERIQMIIADIVLDLIPVGVPEVSKKISLEMMLLGGMLFHNSQKIVYHHGFKRK